MSFMAEQNRADSRQEQVYPKCCISAIIWNSPWTGFFVLPLNTSWSIIAQVEVSIKPGELHSLSPLLCALNCSLQGF